MSTVRRRRRNAVLAFLAGLALLTSCATVAGTPVRQSDAQPTLPGQPTLSGQPTLPGQITVPRSNSATTPGTSPASPGRSTPGSSPQSSASPGSPTTSAHPSVAVPPGLEKFYAQQLDWGECEPYATTEDDRAAYRTPGISCARLTLPMDYADPDGPTISIGVLRKPATGQKQGSVLFNPGGPGASGMSIVATIAEYDADPTLNAAFDLVGFDPRGVGSSQPYIACQSDEQRDKNRAENWPGFMPTSTQAEVDAANQASKTFAADCVQTISKQDVDGKAFLASVGTTNVAKDLDVLRAVLGDDKLTYVGWSYGTSIGTQYAEQFPANVRAMILDGAVNPNVDPATDSVDQSRAFQKAFDDFAAWCAGRAGCPWTDASQATGTFQKLARPLMVTPLKLADGRALSYLDAITGVSNALYSDAAWPDLLTALREFAGGNGTALMGMADDYNGRDSSGHYSTLLEAFNAIRCMDNERITDPDAAIALNRKLNEVAPFEDNGEPVAAVFDSCAFWPVPPTMKPHIPDPKGLAPVLVISTTGDPATPYQDGVDLAGYLHGALLTVKGTRHTGFMLSGLSCVDKIGNDYLMNLTVPQDGATCS